MQTCPRCGGALFPPGSVVGWGGQLCQCGTQYDLQKGPQVPQMGHSTLTTFPDGYMRIDPDIYVRLDRIEQKLEKLLNELSNKKG